MPTSWLDSLLLLISLKTGFQLVGPYSHKSIVEGGDLHVGFESLKWVGGNENRFQFEGMTLKFEKAEWIVVKNQLVTMTCKNVRALWQLPSQDTLKGPSSLSWEDWRSTTEQSMVSWFDREKLRRNLQIQAQCPPGTFEALREIVMIRLENYPQKNVSDWEGFSHQVYSEFKNAFEKKLPPELSKYPLHLKLEQGVLMLSLQKENLEKFPTSRNELLSFSSQEKSQLRLVWEPETFSDRIWAKLPKEETPLGGQLSQEEWELLWPELTQIGAPLRNLKLQSSLVREQVSDFQILPFAKNSIEKGLEVRLQLQLRCEHSKKRIPLKALYSIRRQSGLSRLQFESLRWDYDAKIPEEFKFRGEAEVTLDWIFKNMTLKDLIGVELQNSIGLGKGVFSVYGDQEAFAWTQELPELAPIN